MKTMVCGYVCAGVQGMYTCKTGSFGINLVSLFIICFRGWLHMKTYYFGNKPVFLYFDVVEGIGTCNT